MRLNLFAATASCVLLAACGQPQSSQADNAQANMGAAAQPAATAAASVVTPVPMDAVSGDQVKTVMHERHEGMEAIGKASKAIKRALDASPADLETARANAAKIADLSQKAGGWFHAGTGPDVGKTGAKPEIWQNQQDFTGKLGDFQKAAAAFQAAAAGTDVDAIKASFGDLGKSCKACHDKYRKEMHH
jgi:cytochrome c556